MNGIYLTTLNVILTIFILFLNRIFGFYVTALICSFGFLIVLGIGLVAVFASEEEKKWIENK